MRQLSGPESITEHREGRVPDLLYNLGDGLLDDPIQNGWDSKQVDPAVRFVDLFAPCRQGFIVSIEQSRLDLDPVPPQVASDLLDAYPIDSGGPLVGADLLQGSEHIPAFKDHFQ